MRKPIVLAASHLLLALTVALAAPAFAAPGQSGAHAPLYYLALGDSLAVGVQPDATGVGQPTDQGYADQLQAALQATTPTLRLVKLGCPGETTVTMISGGVCRYPKKSQLAEAVAFLRAHRAFVTLVTLDIGADDVLPCVSGDVVDQACIAAAFANTAAHLATILASLREAAGPGVPIVAINYYDPYLAAWLEGPTGQGLALASAQVQALFNAVLGGIYGGFAVPVADVAAAFASDDFATLVTVPGLGTIPNNVALVCEWTWMCAFPPEGPNIHPNAAGYGAIADAILHVLP